MKNISMTKMNSKEQMIISKSMKEDLEFTRRTEEAYRRYEKGEFVEIDADDFIKMLNKIIILDLYHKD